jgi:hypothetical protein
MAAHNAAGLTKFFMGDVRACLPHIESVRALQASGADAGAAALFGEDPGIVCAQYAACVHQILGHPAEAERQFAAGMSAAERLDQPFGQAQMLWSGAVIAREQGDFGTVLQRARSLIAVCTRADIPFWLPAGNVMAGWAATALGDPAGLVQLRAGIEAYARIDVRSTQPYSLGLLAEASARCGDVPAGLRARVRALRIARATGERWYEPELNRLFAELLLLAGRPHAAHRALCRAGALAQAQGAALFTVRAMTRLATLH